MDNSTTCNLVLVFTVFCIAFIVCCQGICLVIAAKKALPRDPNKGVVWQDTEEED